MSEWLREALLLGAIAIILALVVGFTDRQQTGEDDEAGPDFVDEDEIE